MNCPVCNKGPLLLGAENVVRLKTSKGRDTILEASQIRNASVVVEVGDLIHVDCRAKFTNKKTLELILKGGQLEPRTPSTRSSVTEHFNFQTHYIYCGNTVQCRDPKLPRLDDSFSEVRTLAFDKSIDNDICKRTYGWGKEVRDRVNLAVADLHACDAIYHRSCQINLKTGRDKPQKVQVTMDKRPRKVGRPVDPIKEEAFQKTVDYFKDNDEEQFSVSSLTSYMRQCLPDGYEPYENRTLKAKLYHIFGDEIVISTVGGKADIVTFKARATTILHDYHKQSQQKLDEHDEKLLIIKTAAKLLKSDIKSVDSSMKYYPSAVNIENLHSEEVIGFLPETLQTLLQGVFAGKNHDLKVAAIGQAIMQSSRPRGIIAPLQISLGVQLHHHFSSRFLIDTLEKLGFCKSYTEVGNYQKSAAVQQEVVVDVDTCAGEFLQWAADNVDHNIVTLDGACQDI